MEEWAEFLRTLIAMFVVVNPLSAIPVFVTLTSEQTPTVRRRTARVAGLTVVVTLSTSVLAGESVLRLFGIDLPSFQVGGGILLLLIAISMFHATASRAKTTPEETREAAHREAIGVVPLGTPLLAGAGSISTAILYAHNATSPFQTCVLVAISLLIGASVWLVLRAANRIGAVLGTTGINIMTRLMGLILAAVAVKFVTAGIGVLLPGLAK